MNLEDAQQSESGTTAYGATEMARAIASIATNTFRQAIRSKVMGTLFFFAILVISMGFVLGQLSLHHEIRVSRDLSLFATSLFAVITCTHSTVSLFQRDIEQRTIYTILAKPIYRWQFPVGKFLGIMLLNVAVVTLLSAASYAVVLAHGGTIGTSDLAAAYTILLQLWIVGGLAMLMATFSSGLLSGAITISVFAAGNLISQLEQAAETLEVGVLTALLEAIAEALPNFEALNLSTEATYAISVSPTYLGSATAYALLYTAVFLVLAVLIFARKDFE